MISMLREIYPDIFPLSGYLSMLILPEEDLGVVLFGNRSAGEPPYGPVALEIVQPALGS
jgi:hypothetical protein